MCNQKPSVTAEMSTYLVPLIIAITVAMLHPTDATGAYGRVMLGQEDKRPATWSVQKVSA